VTTWRSFKRLSEARRQNAMLDAGHGRNDLAVPELAVLVQDALLHFDAERYALIARCVMPNHVHALIEMHEGYRLNSIVHS
jgi:hypothetical protein